jgi:hypothetical protein
MSKHYPGPWEVHYSDEGTVWVHEVDPSQGHRIICDIPGDMEEIDAAELANADLIAAAPELLDALIDRNTGRLLQYEPDCTAVVSLLIHAADYLSELGGDRTSVAMLRDRAEVVRAAIAKAEGGQP